MAYHVSHISPPPRILTESVCEYCKQRGMRPVRLTITDPGAFHRTRPSPTATIVDVRLVKWSMGALHTLMSSSPARFEPRLKPPVSRVSGAVESVHGWTPYSKHSRRVQNFRWPTWCLLIPSLPTHAGPPAPPPLGSSGRHGGDCTIKTGLTVIIRGGYYLPSQCQRVLALVRHPPQSGCSGHHRLVTARLKLDLRWPSVGVIPSHRDANAYWPPAPSTVQRPLGRRDRTARF